VAGKNEHRIPPIGSFVLDVNWNSSFPKLKPDKCTAVLEINPFHLVSAAKDPDMLQFVVVDLFILVRSVEL